MAPEQFRAEPADARTDQFSFCVALYEALYGERPFAGDSLAALIEAVGARRLREPSQRIRVPAWLRKVVLRGLSVEPGDRFPAMESLLTALARDPERQRRRVLAGVSLAGLLLGGGALGQRALQTSGAALCRNPGGRLAAAWEAPESNPSAPHPRRDATRAAFLATGAKRAGDLWQRAAAILDSYAKRWTAMYAEACEATHVRGEQSAEVLDLRMDCLNRNRDSLRALTDVFATADADTVGSAIDAVNVLPDVERCADVAVLRAVLPPPRDPAARGQVASLRRRVAEARALGDAGRMKEGLTKARPLLAEAETLGYEPVVAEVLALLGFLDAVLGEMKRSVEESERAVWVAEATRHDEVAADAAVMLVGTTGLGLSRFDESERWGRFAEAILKRMGPGHERLKGWLAHNRGTSRVIANELAAAERDLLAAIALKRKTDGGDSPDVAVSINSFADLHERRGDHAAAIDLCDQARAIYERVYGPEHIFVARQDANRCEYLNSLGRHAEALESCRNALAIWEPALGPDHAWLGYALTAAGVALVGLQRPGEALAPLRRARDLRSRGEFDSSARAETWFALARALWEAGGNGAAARDAAETARREYAKAPGTAGKLRDVDAWLVAHDARGATVARR